MTRAAGLLAAAWVLFRQGAIASDELTEDDAAVCQDQGSCRGDFLQVKANIDGRKDKHPKYYRQTLDNSDDLSYFGNITLGRQVIPAILDTGSYEILAFSRTCDDCGSAAPLGYDRKMSSTFVRGTLDTQECYGSGCATAIDGKDTFAAGPLFIRNMDFWLATDANMPVLSVAEFGAIVGMGPPGYTDMVAEYELEYAAPGSDTAQEAEITLSKHTSVLQVLEVKYFSACFEWKSGGAGYLIWNDDAPEEQPVTFTSGTVVSSTMWAVSMTASLVGPTLSVDLGKGAALLDTGTSLIAVPTSIYSTVINSLNHMDADCTNFQEMPDILIEFDGKSYTMPPSSYIGVVVDRVPVDVEPFFQGKTEWREVKHCELLLMDVGEYSTAYGALWILGMPWFRYYYTLFDLGPNPAAPNHRQVWTAPASDDCYPMGEFSHFSKLKTARTTSMWNVNASRMRGPPRWLRRMASKSGGKQMFLPL